MAVRALGSRDAWAHATQRTLQETFGLSPGANLYLTPPGVQGGAGGCLVEKYHVVGDLPELFCPLRSFPLPISIRCTAGMKGGAGLRLLCGGGCYTSLPAGRLV